MQLLQHFDGAVPNSLVELLLEMQTSSGGESSEVDCIVRVVIKLLVLNAEQSLSIGLAFSALGTSDDGHCCCPVGCHHKSSHLTLNL